MSERRVRRMLRDMAGGRPVKVTSPGASSAQLARLACIAEQFGYTYADARQGGGPQGAGMVIALVPDPAPGAQERAARNRAYYPHAGDGGALPPLDPDAVGLLRARILVDLSTRSTGRQRVVTTVLGFAVWGAGIVLRLGADRTSFLIAGAFWVGAMVLVPFLLASGRRKQAEYAAQLRDAGFTPLTDSAGRVRYVPPGGQLPGHGNPFAAKA